MPLAIIAVCGNGYVGYIENAVNYVIRDIEESGMPYHQLKVTVDGISGVSR